MAKKSTVEEIMRALIDLTSDKDRIAERLYGAINREKAGTTKLDGWPTRLGKDGQTRTSKNPYTSVERAATAKPARDRHRELTLDAIKALSDTYKNLQKLVNLLDSIDDLAITNVDSKTCFVCTSKRGKGGDRIVAHRGTVGDRLTQITDLCDPCYSYVVQSAPAGSRKGLLPTDEQIADHERRGRWRVKVTDRGV